MRKYTIWSPISKFIVKVRVARVLAQYRVQYHDEFKSTVITQQTVIFASVI